MLIETVNLHIWGYCNLRCLYCYGQFPDRPRSLPLTAWQAILGQLAEHGVRRVTFSGGEPTLHPDLLAMLGCARVLGLQRSIITNGTFLTDEMLAELDLVGITLDAPDDETLRAMGRGLSGGRSYAQHVRSLVTRARDMGVRVKLNTVVTAMNVNVDLTDVLLEMRPNKWKPMQFTEVLGENDESAPRLRVSESDFQRFVQRHAAVERAGIWVEPESESTIRRTYVMIDPLGRVFQHADGAHRVSRPVLEVGVARALEEAGGYDRSAFEARRGHVDVRRLPVLQGGAR